MTNYPAELEILPFSKSPQCTVSVPGSKSITNRALVLAAVSSWGTDCTLTDALRSEDTEIMVDGLLRLGYKIEADWPTIRVLRHDGSNLVPATSADLFIGNSGTTMRFLTALCAIGNGRFRIDGIPRMRERPIEDLLSALRDCGVNAYSESGNGCPPVVIESHGLTGAGAMIRGETSSQFVSALLMVAPWNERGSLGFGVGLSGPLVSEPYVRMTEQMMLHWGATWGYDEAQRLYMFNFNSRNNYSGVPNYVIEPDASAASYFFAAAAITGGRVTVRGMKPDLLQGDVKFVDALELMGCRVEVCDEGITVHGKPLRGIDIDMNAISDTVMTLAAVACFAEGPTTIRNVGHIRHKETDRIAAIANELRKIGAGVEEYPDGLRIEPGPFLGARIETYNDHRMAMSLALIGLKVPGVVILNPGCVAKTYPDFWHDFEALRV